MVKYVFLDHGIGLFESIPVKQFISRNPFPVLSTRGSLHMYSRGKQVEEIVSNLKDGKITSSTGDASRGRGIPLILDNAKTNHFSDFRIVSNDAYIDIRSNEVSVMNENFNGTLFYFEQQRIE